MHPLDKAALNSLKKLPGLNKAIKLMMKYSYEKFIRVNELADDIKVSNRTLFERLEVLLKGRISDPRDICPIDVPAIDLQ